MQKLLLAQQDDANLAAIGKTLPVLFEKRGREKDQYVGRTPHLQPVHVKGASDLIGKIRDVRIEARTANSLKGVAGGCLRLRAKTRAPKPRQTGPRPQNSWCAHALVSRIVGAYNRRGKSP